MKKYSVFLTKNEDSGCFSAANTDGYGLTLNGLSEDDKGKGISPMEMLLSATGGCAGIDIVCLLKKEEFTLDSFDIQVNGERNLRETPAYFRKVELIFRSSGDISSEKMNQIIQLSLDKYCSVGKTLEAFAEIHWSLIHNGIIGQVNLLDSSAKNSMEAVLIDKDEKS